MAKRPLAAQPFSVWMACTHDSFHAIHSSYDHQSGWLVYHWICERCGARLSEARRERYRPHYDPHGNERFQSAQVR